MARKLTLFLLVAPLAFGQGSQLPKYTVATLPAASSQITYTVQVIDGTTNTDCITGGAVGTARFNVLCGVKWNGSAYIWSPINTNPGGGGPSIQTNGTPNASQTTLNHVDTASVKWSNPSGGVEQATVSVQGGIQQQLTPPAVGQFVIIYPTAVTPTSSGISVNANNQSATFTMVKNCSLTSTGSATWSFTGALAAQAPYVNPANVTAVYAFAVSANISGQAGGAGCLHPLLPSIQTVTLNATGTGSTSPDLTNPGPAWTLQQATGQMSGLTGANIGTVQINETSTVSGDFLGPNQFNVPLLGLFVYYAGTAPPTDTTVKMQAPLFFNSDLNTIGIDPSAVFPSQILQGTNVYALPSAGANKGAIVAVANATAANTCTPDAGGTFQILCQSDGTNWNPYVPSGGGTTTNALTAQTSGGASPGDTFNGSAAKIWDFHTFGALPVANPTPTGTLDGSGLTAEKLPVGAGCVTTSNGNICYDSTNKNWHLWVNGADSLLIPLAAGFVSGHCGQPTNTGGTWTIVDVGGACGVSGGGASFSAITSGTNTTATMLVGSGASLGPTGTGTINATAIDGVAVTGTPTAGQVPTATSGSAATWQTPTSGGTTVDVLSDQRANGSPFHQNNEYLAVTSGTTYTLLSQTGAGVVSSIHLVFNPSSGTGCAGLMPAIISITVNGGGSPTISMPVAAFFGSGYEGCGSSFPVWNSEFFGGSSNCTLGSGASTNLCNGSGTPSAGVYSKMPIPFANGITITLKMSGSGTLWTQVQGDAAADSWPNTRKLWAQYICPSTAGSSALCGTATGNSTAYYAQNKIVDYAGANPGRYIGTYFLNDDTPGNLSPRLSTLEGNYRIFVDASNDVWTANKTLSGSTKIMDPNGNLQTASSGTEGATIPATWGCTTGATTTDNTVTWTATVGEPWTVWRGSKPYSLRCMSVYDSNGNVETVTTTGTSGGSAPAWPSTGSCPGTTTSDNTVTWTCSLGSTAIKAWSSSTGTEDYFFGNNYFANWISPTYYGTFGMESGVEFPYEASAGTVAAYRFYLREPIRFNNSITVYRSNGDSSQVVLSSGTSTSLETGWFYTQDTN